MAVCEQHWEEAVGSCRDCGRAVCGPCRVQVRRIGTLCTHCALVRAGLRSKGAVRAA